MPTVIMPDWSVRSQEIPASVRRCRSSGLGCPYILLSPAEITAKSAWNDAKNSSDVAFRDPWWATFNKEVRSRQDPSRGSSRVPGSGTAADDLFRYPSRSFSPSPSRSPVRRAEKSPYLRQSVVDDDLSVDDHSRAVTDLLDQIEKMGGNDHAFSLFFH